MNGRAALANVAWLASSLPAAARFGKALREPGRVQGTLLDRLLRRNARCAYGRSHAFGEIRSYAEFASRVPLTSYDELEPWIARIRRGEQGALLEDPVTRLVPTSGSSGARKLIPFSAALQHGFNAALGPWIVDLCRSDPALALGPAFWSVTPVAGNPEQEASAVPIGFDDDAAYLGGFRSWLLDAAMAVPSALRDVSGVGPYRRIALLLLLRARNLRMMSVWHPSFLSLLLEALPAEWEGLLRDIHLGGCSRRDGIPPSVLGRIQLRADPRRAAELARIGPAFPATIWPELRLISCWGDGHSALAFADLGRRFPGVRLQAKGLLATEGVVTIPYRGHFPLAVTSHFYEFVGQRGEILRAEELREGGLYEVVVTTGGGLWRYRLGDQVEVAGFLEATPSLRFVGRPRLVSDRFGEKLSEAFVGRALARIWDHSPAKPAFALLAPEEESALRAHYTLFVEEPLPERLAPRLDTALRENPQYSYCRDLGQLGPPRVFRIAGAGYSAFVGMEVSRGMRLGDLKPISLSPRTDWSRCFEGGYLSLE